MDEHGHTHRPGGDVRGPLDRHTHHGDEAVRPGSYDTDSSLAVRSTASRNRRIGRTTNCRDGRPGGGSAAIPRRGGSPRDTDDPGRHQSRLGGRGCDTQVNGAAEGRGGEDGVFDQALNQDPTAGVRLLKPGRSEIPWRRARNRRGAQLSKAGGDHDYGVLAGQIRPVVHRGRPGVTAHSIRDGRQGRLLGPGSARAGRPAAGSGRPWGIRPPT